MELITALVQSKMYHKLIVIFLSVISTVNINGLEIIDANPPPDPNQAALMARYIIHHVGWVAVSSISVIKEIKSYPYNTILEMSDGVNKDGNGVPYLYVTIFDPFHIDTQENNRCTLVASLASTPWCKQQHLEEEDPRCGRVMLTGRFVKVDNNTEEYKGALENMFTRHPKTKYWPSAHHFYLSKIEIELVTLFDSFGGLKTISTEDYFKANGYQHNLYKNKT